MRLSGRLMLAIAVFLGVAALIVGGRSYEARRAASASFSTTTAVSVTNGADRGAGTLREALFLVATAPGPARITLKVPKVSLLTALPPIVNSHGVRIVAAQGGSEIDAGTLSGGGPVLDVAAPNVSIDGLTVSHCANAAILVRAARFSLQNAIVKACDVGVDVAENAHDLLLEGNQFVNDRVGVRFAGSSPGTTVAANVFSGEKDAGLWGVRGEPDLGATAISVHDNRFENDHSGVVAGNLSILIEQNQITGAQSAAIDVVGAGVVVRGNHVSGGTGMGIISDGARAVVIERNELHGLAAYGIMIRGSSSALVSANRLYDCAYGLAFVLGDPRNPSTAVDNVIIEPHYDGIDVIGDAPILRGNQVVMPHAFALRVADFSRPDGSKVVSAPFLDHNSFPPPAKNAVAALRGRSLRQ